MWRGNIRSSQFVQQRTESSPVKMSSVLILPLWNFNCQWKNFVHRQHLLMKSTSLRWSVSLVDVGNSCGERTRLSPSLSFPSRTLFFDVLLLFEEEKKTYFFSSYLITFFKYPSFYASNSISKVFQEKLYKICRLTICRPICLSVSNCSFAVVLSTWRGFPMERVFHHCSGMEWAPCCWCRSF